MTEVGTGAGNPEEGTLPSLRSGERVMESFPEVVPKPGPERQTETGEAEGTPEEGPSKQKYERAQRPAAERRAMPPASPPLYQACSPAAGARNLANSLTLLTNG